jgi:two-component system, LytTR family, response regulator
MKTVIIDNEPNHFQSLEQEILFSCPQINIRGYAHTHEEAARLITEVEPALVFMEVNMHASTAFEFLDKFPEANFETIFVAHSSQEAIEAIKCQASGYILKPLKMEELISAIEVAERRIKLKEALAHEGLGEPRAGQGIFFPDELIGIPTMEGFEFLPIKEIIRCEGYQRCTRIITKDRSDIISSYHIGLFAKRLEAKCFYATHKSHLINLHHIRTYLKEGTIKMADGASVPVSKRRKCEFLKMLSHCR